MRGWRHAPHAAVRIDPVEPPDETSLRAWFDLERAAQAVDRPGDPAPSWAWHRALLAAPWPGEQARAWLARVDGAVVGAALLGLPQCDNTDTASGEIVVDPLHRRAGIGTCLLAVLRAEARSAGRTRMALEAQAPLLGPSPGAAFAAAAGARETLANVRRRLRLDDGGDRIRADLEATATAASPGYDIVQWSDGTPDEWCDDIGRLIARMSTDAPSGDRHREPEVHDAARVRERDAMCRARGVGITVTAARSRDGELVAFTEVATSAEQDEDTGTWFTLVRPEHRGRRLGLRVKLANLALARRLHPGMRRTDTYNAASNTHMIAINEAMGFRPHDLLGEYELVL